MSSRFAERSLPWGPNYSRFGDFTTGPPGERSGLPWLLIGESAMRGPADEDGLIGPPELPGPVTIPLGPPLPKAGPTGPTKI
jgi:hypothetical protein